VDLISKFRLIQEKEKINFCLDLSNGSIVKSEELGIIESCKLKNQMIISALEAVEMIIRVDELIVFSPENN
jgi:T-complex protein 1 subunit beta